MSSQTPNINLTLPTGVEKVSRQIINDNNTKIDTAIGTLNSNISNTLVGSYSSRLAAAQAIIDSMGNNTVKVGRVGVSGIANYVFYALKTSATNAYVFLGSNPPRYYSLTSGTWTENVVAIDDNLFPSSVSVTRSGILGNFISGYGCKAYLPFFGADKYTWTIVDVTIYGITGSKKSDFESTTSVSRDSITITSKGTVDYSGKAATVVLTGTRN